MFIILDLLLINQEENDYVQCNEFKLEDINHIVLKEIHMLQDLMVKLRKQIFLEVEQKD